MSEAASETETPRRDDEPETLANDETATPHWQRGLDTVLEAHRHGAALEGKVIGWNRGGFHISLDGVAAFCPRSMMEISNPRKPKTYLDRTFEFRVAEIDAAARRIVVSRKELLAEQREAERRRIRDQLRVGAVLEGVVDSLADFGAFVDLGGGLRGLVHVTELSRKRVERPSEVVQPGQKVEVKVINLTERGERISLSLRALEPDPWQGLDEKYQRGSTFRGTVLRHAEFGLFVEVEPGIEGLVHVSQLGPGAEMSDPALAEGQTLEGWVREVDVPRHRLSLALREVPPGDPWEGIERRYEEGKLVQGRVEQASRFGFFVELEPGVTGLLPFSEVPAPPGRKKEHAYRPGQTVSVQVLELDNRRRKISLGREGSASEGTSADLRAYKKRQHHESAGLNTLAAAFEKLKRDES